MERFKLEAKKFGTKWVVTRNGRFWCLPYKNTKASAVQHAASSTTNMLDNIQDYLAERKTRAERHVLNDIKDVRQFELF